MKGRKPKDWDIIIESNKKVVSKNGQILDIIDANSILEPTNRIIYEKSQSSNILLDSPIGKVKVIPLTLLKVMKISSIPLNKFKNESDLKILKKIKLSKEYKELSQKRTKETEEKVDKQKKKFFDKKQIPRFFKHDELHRYINKNNPAYLKILNKDAVTPDKKLFKYLSPKEKRILFWEEAFVLAMERSFVVNVRKYPMFLEKYCDSFFKVENSSDPSIHWLNKLCSQNAIIDHPEWLAKWGKKNYWYILKGYKKWWEKTFDNIPKSFWERLLKF